LGDEEAGKEARNPMLHRPKLWEPERDCIRLRSVGCNQDKLSRRSAQVAKPGRVQICDG